MGKGTQVRVLDLRVIAWQESGTAHPTITHKVVAIAKKARSLTLRAIALQSGT
jgi:hypothetical protein